MIYIICSRLAKEIVPDGRRLRTPTGFEQRGLDREPQADGEHVSNPLGPEGICQLIRIDDVVDVWREPEIRADLYAISELHHDLMAGQIVRIATRSSGGANVVQSQSAECLIVDHKRDGVCPAAWEGPALQQPELKEAILVDATGNLRHGQAEQSQTALVISSRSPYHLFDAEIRTGAAVACGVQTP